MGVRQDGREGHEGLWIALHQLAVTAKQGWFCRFTQATAHLSSPPRPPAHLLDDFAARVLNLLLARQEHQDVAGRLARVDLDHRADGGLQVVALRLLLEE